RSRVAGGAELGVVGVGGEEVDVGHVGGITLAKMSGELREIGKGGGRGFIDDVVAVKSRVAFDAVDEVVQFLFLIGFVEDGGVEKAIVNHAAQAVALEEIELSLATPDDVEVAPLHLTGDRKSTRL